MKKLLFWGFLIAVALVRFVTTKPTFPEGKNVRITGLITQDPVVYSYSQKVNLNDVKVFLPKYPEIDYGDVISVTGSIKNGELANAKLLTNDEKVLPFSNIRQKIISFYQRTLPEPHASLLAGIVLGSKKELPFSFWQNIKKTGLAHVVVASGMNVTLVSGFLLSVLLLFISRRNAIVLALLGIWSYVLISGIEAPLVRAAIMGSIIFIGQFFGRVTSILRILFFTSLIMIIIFPRWVTDIGFILSFVATFSLILFQPRVERWFAYLPGLFKEGVVTSIAAQIGVAPIILVTFGNFSAWSPLINALVLWTVAPITIIGLIGGIVALIIPTLGQLILYLAYPLTAWFIGITRLFSSI